MNTAIVSRIVTIDFTLSKFFMIFLSLVIGKPTAAEVLPPPVSGGCDALQTEGLLNEEYDALLVVVLEIRCVFLVPLVGEFG